MTHRPQPPAPADPWRQHGVAGQAPGTAGWENHRAVRGAVLAYLGIPVAGILPPLWVYVRSRRHSAFARRHAGEALRVASAAVIYGICALIVGAMLALDSVKVAVIVVGPLALALWLAVVVFVSRAAYAASRDRPYQVPGWLRVSPRE
jgi:uncharacterized Tic20 family protein